jgi:hypothetical protein
MMNSHHPNHSARRYAKLQFSIGAAIVLCGGLLLSCKEQGALGEPVEVGHVEAGPVKATMTAQLGVLEIGVSIDENGHVTLSSGLTPKARINLGPVSLQFGIERSIEIAQQKSFQLIVLRQDQSGNIERTEYEVGQKFELNFSPQEWVRQIRSENDSILVVVESLALPHTPSLAATNPEWTGQSPPAIENAPIGGEIHLPTQEPQESQAQPEPDRYAETPEAPVSPQPLSGRHIISVPY